MAAVSGAGGLDDAARAAAFSALVDEAPFGIAILDRHMRYVVVNELLAAVNGIAPDQHIGRTLREVIPDLPPALEAGLRRTLETGVSIRGLQVEATTPASPDLLRRFELSFHPLRTADGAIDGVVATVAELTEGSRAVEVLRASERRYRSLVEATTSLVWTVLPGQQSHADWLAAVHPDDQERLAQEWMTAVDEGRRFESEVRVDTHRGLRHVVVRAVPVVEGGEIREWVGASSDVSAARRAEQALRESEARVRLAVEAGRIGLWDLDLATQRIEWSAETAAIFGMRLEDFGGDWPSFAANVQPDDVQAIEEQIARITPALGAFEYEMRVGRDGEWTRRVLSRGQVIADAEGHPSHMVGMVADVTEQWRQSEEISRILESIGDAFYALDAAGRFTYVNAEAARLLQRRPADLLGRVVWEEFPEGVGTEFEENFRRAFVRQQVVSFEARYAPLDGWFELRVFPTPTGISVYFRNIDELRAAERERQALEQEREAAAGRTAHLGAVAAALAEALREGDVTRIVLDNARAALGARGGAIALFEPGTDELHFAAVGWPEPEAEEVLRSDLTADRPTTEAARRRVPVFVTGPDDLTRRFPAMVELFARVGDQAIASVPLLVHGDCLGAMTLTWTEPRAFSDEDRQFVAALGDTCAQALERARLYEREHRVAETLQLALLPERLADPDGISSAARYLPGTEGVAVGGDWYDLFDLGDSRLGIVLGDVVGKGVGAAAVMGRLRNALRAYATVVDDPAEVLARVDDFAGRFGSNDLATLVYGVLDTGTGELRFSSAGHLPPLAVRADGYTGYLAGDPDLPVGVSAPVGRTEHRVRFSSGTTLVLYSDGLVEDRKRSLDDGLQLLAEVAAATAGSDADATCDRIVTELVGAAGGDDDVAVLVLQWDGPPSPERCTAVLPPVVASARRARALVTEQLEQWGEDELQETAQLCVSEIVTNAVVHAGTPVQLDVILTADRVRIEVVDGGAAPPERVEADDEDVHGRGIAIVELLSSDWGVERRDDGKCVWFELERTAGGPPTSAAS